VRRCGRDKDKKEAHRQERNACQLPVRNIPPCPDCTPCANNCTHINTTRLTLFNCVQKKIFNKHCQRFVKLKRRELTHYPDARKQGMKSNDMAVQQQKTD